MSSVDGAPVIGGTVSSDDCCKQKQCATRRGDSFAMGGETDVSTTDAEGLESSDHDTSGADDDEEDAHEDFVMDLKEFARNW